MFACTPVDLPTYLPTEAHRRQSRCSTQHSARNPPTSHFSFCLPTHKKKKKSHDPQLHCYSFEAGRSGRGDRIVGEVHLPLEAAQLIPGTTSSFDGSCGGGGGGGGDRGAAYRLSGDWELQGALGDSLGGARVGADIVVHGPPSPTSAAGRLKRMRRESVGWYAR